MAYSPDARAGERVSADDSLKVEMIILDAEMKFREDFAVAFGIGIGGSVISDVKVLGDVAYFGGCDRRFYAVDKYAGKELWHFEAGGIIWNFEIKDNIIFFSCHDGCIYAITTEGKLVWKYSSLDKISCKPAIAGGKVYFVGKDGHLHALDAKTGKLLWKVVDNSPSWGNPFVHKGIVYVGFASGNCYAVNPDGTVKWKFTAKGPTGSPVYNKGIVYFPSYDGNLYALNEKGEIQWKVYCKEKLMIYIHPSIIEDNVFIASLFMVYCIRPDGRIVWKITTPSMTSNNPIAHGSRVYFSTIDGNLYCADKRTGEVIFRKNIGGKPINLAIDNERIFFTCYDCKVVCTDLEGNVLWVFPTSLSYVSPISFEDLNPKIISTGSIANLEIPEEPSLYRPVSSVTTQFQESGYGGLNIGYASSSQYVTRRRYGGGKD